MKRFKKVLLGLVGAVMMGVALTSCSYDFYSDFHGAGADIETTHSFEAIDSKKVEELRSSNDSKENHFVLFIGSSADENCVSNITTLQKEFTYNGFEGKAYFLSVKDVTKATEKKELVKTLSVNALTSTTNGLVVVEYEGRGVVFDTSNPNDEYVNSNFKVNSNGALSFTAIADYVALYF